MRMLCDRNKRAFDIDHTAPAFRKPQRSNPIATLYLPGGGLLVLLGILLMVWTHPAVALDAQTIFENNEQALFQIRVINRQTGEKNSIGSGFIFDRPNRLASNYHVVSNFIEKPERYALRYLAADGREGALRLIAVDAVHDLVLLDADTDLGTPLRVGEPPPKGAGLFAMGNPLDLGLTIAAGTNGGILGQTDGSRILFSGSLNPGMSGGPTFDDQGVVVGINVSTARNDISFIVPARFLRQLTGAKPRLPETVLADISEQIRNYQIGYLERINAEPWAKTRLGNLLLPGSISPTIRCWDASSKPKPERLYQRFSISCENENEIYLTDRLDVGKIVYEYLLIETKQLEPLRFYRLYRSLNKSQFSSRAKKDDVSRFQCATRLVDVNGPIMKTTMCARAYKNYPALSDILFTAAITGKKDVGFIFNLDMAGTDFTSASRLIARFLQEIRWQP